jgi:hypothetical protein
MNIMEEVPKDRPKTPPPISFSTSMKKNTISSDPSNYQPVSSYLGFFDWKMFFIILLFIIIVLIVILTSFGINILDIIGDAIKTGLSKLPPSFKSFFGLVGDSTGAAINGAANITADAAKTGIDIAEGTVQNVGNIIIGDEAVGHGPRKSYDPQPDAPEDSIQKSLTSAKTKWCLVGEYQNKRGCIDISESDKCLSGQVFPNEEMCLGGIQHAN